MVINLTFVTVIALHIHWLFVLIDVVYYLCYTVWAVSITVWDRMRQIWLILYPLFVLLYKLMNVSSIDTIELCFVLLISWR